MSVIPTFELSSTEYLEEVQPSRKDESNRTAFIILNSPICGFDYVLRLYRHACFRLCADGGANRLHDLLIETCGREDVRDCLAQCLPDLIHGDLDSLRDDVRRNYESLKVEISHDPDQYSTDFGKAIKEVFQRVPDLQDVLILGSIGGRVDQGVGLLGELYREQIIRHPGLRFWLFSESSVSTILLTGSTKIHTPLATGLIKRNVGILPVYGPALITTQGFEWDVHDWPTEMGGQMSTSNHIVASDVVVTTDREVLFTVQRATDN